MANYAPFYLGSPVCFRSKNTDVGLMKFIWPIDLSLGWFCFHLFVVIWQTLFKSRFPSCSCWYAFSCWSKQQSIILDKSRWALKMRAMITVEKVYFDFRLFFFYHCDITVEISLVFYVQIHEDSTWDDKDFHVHADFLKQKNVRPVRSHGSQDKCFESVVLESFRHAVFFVILITT